MSDYPLLRKTTAVANGFQDRARREYHAGQYAAAEASQRREVVLRDAIATDTKAVKRRIRELSRELDQASSALQRVRDELSTSTGDDDLQYVHTHDPLPTGEEHPDCGACWDERITRALNAAEGPPQK